jgi:adenylylsulfate kinase
MINRSEKKAVQSSNRPAHLKSGQTIWLTGLSASGKSTLACAIEDRLKSTDVPCCVLDGDILRQGLNRDLGYSAADRQENIRRVAEMAKVMNDAGLVVICALISPLIADRAMAKAIIGEQSFIEVYVSTPLAVCEARDPKGLYSRARSGDLLEFTGVSASYEAPPHPNLMIDTSVDLLETSLNKIKSLIKLI